MASFGGKRKARVIQTLDLEEDGPSLLGGEELKKDVSLSPQGPIKFGRNKPSKSSSLRKSINVDDLDPDGAKDGAREEDDEPSEPVVVRPSISRAGSTKQKKRQSGSSRLSFGVGEGQADGPATPKKSLNQKTLELNALKHHLPTRILGGDEERPRYSKEYLEELQSSTPNTPQNLGSLNLDDEMNLDPSELDGALIVQSQDLARRSPSARPSAKILSEAEIREKKERRARLAQESDFISLDDSDENEVDGSGRITVEFKKNKAESRLIAEDEDLGEGYDEFVLDGKLALGKRAEKEAEKRHRQEMVDLIQAAEDGSDAESDDSEAERRAAYEAAQRRAGMDGLARHEDDEDLDGDGASHIPRMKPLPDLDDVLQRMQRLVQGLEDDVAAKRRRIKELEADKQEILTREQEVQDILNQAGEKYRSVMAQGGAQAASVATQSPLRPLPPGIAGDLPVERGLESFGTTPTTRPDIDVEMG
ncbi:hypothetical protein GQ53DRAFT_712485 [Thozetella sp. PMI_491]|nr:hypothetical protein GQ53DRAFT_712485 [Thozetella sp. PMI_491]